MLLLEAIVSVRVSRRAIAAVIMDDDRLSLSDGFHLNSRRERAERSSERYIEKLLSRFPIKGVVVYAPNTDEGATSSVLRAVQTAIVRAGIPIRLITKEELLKAFGRPALRHWTQLRQIAECYWPQLAEVHSAAKPFIVDAAAVGLYAEAFLALTGTPR